MPPILRSKCRNLSDMNGMTHRGERFKEIDSFLSLETPRNNSAFVPYGQIVLVSLDFEHSSGID